MKIEITKLEAIINTSKKIIASRKKITKIDAVYLDRSNSQAYKQAGNTIARAVLANTIAKLNGIT